ncbi:MAG: ATP-binding cassette domain-containing protein [Actinomycetota bacterium]
MESVSYSYASRSPSKPALDEVSLSVAAGELVVVAGLSGSGKSTLLRAASGLVPHFHGGEMAGRVVVGGMDTREHGPGDLAAVCGTLLQDPETQIVMATVASELAFGLENRGLGATAVAREVQEVALALGIAPLLERATHELSGGELQRVALGAALVGRPGLVVLDEPTSQLDPVAGDELIWLVRRLNEQWGTAVILAEQRIERCLAAADRVVVMDAGRIVCDATPAEFLVWAGRSCKALQTPAAELLGSAGIGPPPTGVKAARATLAAHGLLTPSGAPEAQSELEVNGTPRRRPWRRSLKANPAIEFKHVWHEIRNGPTVIRDVCLSIAAGEMVALMGANGAGKSTLLRHAAGLMKPTRGSVNVDGRVALLLQNPGDYLVHECVGDELEIEALRGAGLDHLVDRHPRDLSGGERQRLALAIVTAEPATATAALGAICLDEPTRGMDHGHRAELVAQLRDFGDRGSAVLVATHDPELAAAFADRVILVGDGVVVADGSVAAILGSGWYFATETARVLGGAGGALLPADGASLLRSRLAKAPLELKVAP